MPLFTEHGDDPNAYETQMLGGLQALAHKPNGDCVYLGEKGCTIHERRPAVCRAYDCAGQFRQFTRAERRRGVREKWLDPAILARGREIAEQYNKIVISGRESAA